MKSARLMRVYRITTKTITAVRITASKTTVIAYNETEIATKYPYSLSVIEILLVLSPEIIKITCGDGKYEEYDHIQRKFLSNNK